MDRNTTKLTYVYLNKQTIWFFLSYLSTYIFERAIQLSICNNNLIGKVINKHGNRVFSATSVNIKVFDVAHLRFPNVANNFNTFLSHVTLVTDEFLIVLEAI